MNKSVETRVTISIKDGTDKHVKSVSNKDVDLSGPMEDPKFQILVLQDAIAIIKGELAQTTLDDAGTKKEPAPAKKEAAKK